MIEPIMYFGIGFLVAALIGLVVGPLVHGRAVRLTMRRLEAATIAFVQPGQMQPETDFNFRFDGEDTVSIEQVQDRFGRRGTKWFSFDVPGERPRLGPPSSRMCCVN